MSLWRPVKLSELHLYAISKDALKGNVKLANQKPSFVVVGAGAIGSSVTGWIAPKHDNLFLLARGENAGIIKKQGLKFYLKDEEANVLPVPVKIIETINEIPPPDIIVISLKNCDLEAMVTTLRKQLWPHQPIIVALQNGIENQRILPKYFTKVIFGVVCFNAWRDGPGRVGHQTRIHHPRYPRNDLQTEQQQVAATLQLGLDCNLTNRLQDAVHYKLAIKPNKRLSRPYSIPRPPYEFVPCPHSNVLKDHLGRNPSYQGSRL